MLFVLGYQWDGGGEVLVETGPRESSDDKPTVLRMNDARLASAYSVEKEKHATATEAERAAFLAEIRTRGDDIAGAPRTTPTQIDGVPASATGFEIGMTWRYRLLHRGVWVAAQGHQIDFSRCVFTPVVDLQPYIRGRQLLREGKP